MYINVSLIYSLEKKKIRKDERQSSIAKIRNIHIHLKNAFSVRKRLSRGSARVMMSEEGMLREDNDIVGKREKRNKYKHSLAAITHFIKIQQSTPLETVPALFRLLSFLFLCFVFSFYFFLNRFENTLRRVHA